MLLYDNRLAKGACRASTAIRHSRRANMPSPGECGASQKVVMWACLGEPSTAVRKISNPRAEQSGTASGLAALSGGSRPPSIPRTVKLGRPFSPVEQGAGESQIERCARARVPAATARRERSSYRRSGRTKGRDQPGRPGWSRGAASCTCGGKSKQTRFTLAKGKLLLMQPARATAQTACPSPARGAPNDRRSGSP